MKKNILVLLALVAIIGFGSCKSREKCPAYGSKHTAKFHGHRS